MRKFYTFGLMVLAVFAFGGVAASSAFAVELPQWLVNGATIALNTEKHVEILAEGNLLLLEDMGVGTAIQCTPIGLGQVLSNGAGTQETGECTNITVEKGECGEPVVQAVNLPWTTSLVQVGTEFESGIKGSGTTAAGWLVECLVGIFLVDDTCTTNAGKVLVSNEADGLVHAEFMESAVEAEWANCTVGGLNGLVVGLFFLHALGTNAEELETLAVNLAAEVI
jgi:hypothetical protein